MKLEVPRQYRKVGIVVAIVLVLNLVYFAAKPPNFSHRDLVRVATGQNKQTRVYHKDDKAKIAILERFDIKNAQTAPAAHLRFAKPREVVLAKDLQKQGYSIIYVDEYDYSNTTSVFKDDKVDPHVVLKKLEYEDHFKDSFVKFFKELFDHIAVCKPSVPPINNDDHYRLAREENKYTHRNGRIPTYGGHWRENYLEEPIRTIHMLNNFLRLDSDEVSSLKQSHETFVKSMFTEYPQDLYKYSQYNSFMKGDGIVYLGGDDYNQLALLSIKMLRSAGSQLPVELIVPKEGDYDIDLCNTILPSLNGRCKVMAHYLPKEYVDNIKGYQMKNVALLISSFKNVLYLDADNIPLQNPDNLFVNGPFTNNHLVLWPDLWRRSTSPSFYTIADIKIDPSERIRKSYFNGDNRANSPEISLHDALGTIPEASSETGQILINKEVHLKSLILSMYYNFYGPDYFYPLFSQGAAGEGDKETFIAAAHKMELPYYQVKEFNREFGPMNSKNKHEFFGMGQYDPLVDYVQDNNRALSMDNEYVPDYAVNSDDKEHLNYNYHYFKASNLMFLHANWPKYKLHEMFILNSFDRGPKHNDHRRRLYDWNIIEEGHGTDIELSIMTSLQWLYCVMNINLKKVPEVFLEDRVKICLEINSHISFLVSGEKSA